MTVEIRGLPPGLRDVPSGNTRDWDVPGQWKEWGKEIRKHRIKQRYLADNNESLRAIEIKRCRDDPNYEICMYGFIDEPRKLFGEGIGGQLPFILFPRQIELGHEISERMNDIDHRHIWVDKSRGFGATLYIVQYLLNRWKWETPFSGYLVSFDEGQVKKSDTDEVGSLMAKFHYALDRHPEWLRPNDYLTGSMGLLNKANGNSITGWTTTKRSGRGGRARFGLLNEAAQIRYLNNLIASMGEAVDSLIGESTQSDEVSMEWADMTEHLKEFGDDDQRPTAYGAKKMGLFEIDYHHNPYMTEDWIARRRKEYEQRNDLPRFMAEYMRDARTANTGYIYPTITKRPIRDDIGFDPAKVTVFGIDAGGDDFTALNLFQLDYERPLLNQDMLEMPQINVIDCYINSGVPAELYAHILTGVEPDEEDIAYASFNFDPASFDMQFMTMTGRIIPDPFMYRLFSDPTANNTELASRVSFVQLVENQMEILYKRKLKKHYRPNILSHYGEKFTHQHRQLVTQRAIPYMIFASTLGARRVYDSLKRRRLTNTNRVSSSAPVAAHERMWSDVATGVEYAMVGIEADLQPNRARRVPVEHDITGAVIR